MKKLYMILVILILAATLITGCEDDTETEDVYAPNPQNGEYLPAPFVNRTSLRKESEIKLEDYVTAYSLDDGSIRYKLSLQQYLDDYGAMETQFFNNDEQEVRFAVRFDNGTILGMSFRNQPDVAADTRELTEVVVTAGKPDYKFTSYEALKNASKLKNKKLAKWSREFIFYGYNGSIDERYLHWGDSGSDRAPFLVNFNDQSLYFFNDKPLYLPLDFDYVFKKTVAPYLDMAHVPLRKDPFKDKKFK